MASPSAVLSILVKANTSDATTGLLRVNQQLELTDKRGAKVARTLETVAKAGALIGGAAVVGGMVYATKKAADFEEQMSALGAVSEASGKQMERMRKQALKAGADTKFSALEAAQAQTELAKGGLAVAQIAKGGLRSALALAAAGEMELADAAEATVNAMKLFGLRGRDAMKVADGFATAANRTTADVSDFALALKMGGSAAKAAGLTFVETTAALEALAEGGIRGSDAGTSLKAMLVQLAAPNEKQIGLMEKLGLRFFDAEGNMKGLAETAGMLRKALGGMTAEQRLATVKTLAGTDGMRALLALYDAGPAKLQKFQKELSREGSAAEVAAKKQDNLKGSLEQLQGSIETLGIQVGTALLPVVRTAADELTGFANKVGKIVEREDLSLGEKLQRSLDIAKVEARPWVEKLRVAIDQANIPEKIAAIISAATPVIAAAMAQAGIAAAKTFASAFASSDVWGKLVLGGWLFSRMGGAKGFFGMGAAAGAPFGAGMATTASTGFAGKFRGLLGGLGGLAKKLIVADVLINLVDQQGNPIAAAINSASDLTFGLLPKVDVKTGQEKIDEQLKSMTARVDELVKARDTSGLAAVTEKLRGMAAEARAFGRADLGKQWDQLAQKAAGTADSLNQTQAKVAGMSERFKSNIRGLRVSGNEDFDKLVRNTVFGARQIAKVGGEKSTEARKAIAEQFRIARDRVRDAMRDKVISVKAGTERLRELAAKELKMYGISAGRVNVVLARGANGQMRPNQRGSYIDEGAPSGDSVPSLLERGEYVLNRNAVRKVGKHNLDRLNFGMAPRFQQGGIVELLHPFNDPEGHGGANSHLHVAMLEGIVALGRRLQSMGWLVSEHPAFGGVNARHASGGYHYTGQAIDVNWPMPGEEAAKIREILPLLGSAGLGRVFKGLDRPVLQGPSSVALEAGQGALDRIWQAANASIAAAVSSTGLEGAEGGFKGPWVKVMRAIAKNRGWNLGDWRRLVMKESGGNPAARNPSSGAYGLGQFLGSTAQAYAKYGALSPNGADQIRAMARYIADRYGSPSSALAFHDANNWYHGGGLVAGGGDVPAMLQSGEFVMRKQIVDRFGPTFFAAMNGMQSGGEAAFRHSQAQARNTSRAQRALSKARAKAKKPKGAKGTPRAWDANLAGFIDVAQSALSVAQLTAGTADDIEWLQTLEKLQEQGLREAQRRGDTQAIGRYAEGLSSTRGQLKDFADEKEDELREAIEAQTRATEEHTAALKDVQTELKRQTDLAQSALASDSYQMKKWIADELTSILGRRTVDRGRGPSNGVEVTY